MKRFIQFVGVIAIVTAVVIAGVGSYGSHSFTVQEKPPSELHDVPERLVDVEYVEVTPATDYETEIFVPTEVPLIRTTEYVNLTFEEMELLERIAMAEAEGEDTVGKALIMVVVLNRSLADGQSIHDVIYREGQFATHRMYIEPSDDCHEALAMVMDGWNEQQIEGEWDREKKILFFLPSGYSPYGEPMFQYGGHYFSGR